MFDRVFLKKLLCLTGITIAVYLLFRYLLPLVIPFIFSIILSKWIYPYVRKISDKLRIPYKCVVVITVFIICVLIFAAAGSLCILVLGQIKQLVANVPFIRTEAAEGIQRICTCCDRWLGIDGGKAYSIFLSGTDYIGANWNEKILPFITKEAWNMCRCVISTVVVFLFFLVGAWLIMEDYSEIRDDAKSSDILMHFMPVFNKLQDTLGGYFKTQGTIIFMISVICWFGFFVLGNPYALLIGIIIAVLDAFPIIGSGSILIPWAVIYLFQGRLKEAVMVMITYLLCLCVREISEPRLMGQQTGLRPMYMFISFYVGIRLFGIIGVILGPAGFVTIRTIYSMAFQNEEYKQE